MIQAIQYIVYDLSISDVKERQRQAVVYESGRKLAVEIGIAQNKIPNYTDPAEGKRFASKKTGKEYAIRVAREDQKVTPSKPQIGTYGQVWHQAKEMVPGPKVAATT